MLRNGRYSWSYIFFPYCSPNNFHGRKNQADDFFLVLCKGKAHKIEPRKETPMAPPYKQISDPSKQERYTKVLHDPSGKNDKQMIAR